MKPDFSSYRGVLKRKPAGQMSDAELAETLARREALLSERNRKGTAEFISYATVTAFCIAGVAAMVCGFGGAIPLLSGLAAGYGTFKGGVTTMVFAFKKGMRDRTDLEAERDLRAVRAEHLAKEQEEERRQAILDNARRIKEEFNAAIDAGLPLEEAIQIRNAPLSFKPKT